MKNNSGFVCKVILGIILSVCVFLPYGCTQPGQTRAEGHRKHLRTLRVNQQEMIHDIDRAMLWDQPSRLTERRIPPEID